MSGVAECLCCHDQLPEAEAVAAGWQEWEDANSWACSRPGCQLRLAADQREHYMLEQWEED